MTDLDSILIGAEPLSGDDIEIMIESVRPYTMAPSESLHNLARQVDTALTSDIRGDFVECGVWLGGASFLIAMLLKRARVRDRSVWLVDSFEGLPVPDPIDGNLAIRNTAPERNCNVTLGRVEDIAKNLGVSAYIRFIKGWFEDTLPANRESIGPIALLRTDCNWYASARCCLENLYDQVSDQGFIVLTDYYTFEGAAIAVHEFLAMRRLPHRIESIVRVSHTERFYEGAFFRKSKATWSPSWSWAAAAVREIEQLIPSSESFILVDEDQIRSGLASNRRAIPFLERNGMYWGPPADDDGAIQEMQRLRQDKLNFIVIAWPAFWWLDYYPLWHHMLRSQFKCVLQNNQLLIFDMRAPAQ